MEEYCIIARERAKRPRDFIKPQSKAGRTRDCPFCPGHEDRTPPATAVYKDGGIFTDGRERIRDWQARCFPNQYPAVSASPGQVSGEWIALAGLGSHEVIVESPEHSISPADLSADQWEWILGVYKDRYSYHVGLEGIRYVSIFKNWGERAGASLSHTHTQIVSLPLVPPLMGRELSALESLPFCALCNVVARETSSPRLIAQNQDWVLIAPFFSQTPYESWILPKAHLSSLLDLDQALMSTFGEILSISLQRLAALLGDPPFNYMLYQMPSGYHLNLRIQPVTSHLAGFEKNTGIFINSVPPEQAADDLRRAELPKKAKG